MSKHLIKYESKAESVNADIRVLNSVNLMEIP